MPNTLTGLRGRKHDPLRGFKYRVLIDGEEIGGFSKVSGLSEESEVIEYREGTDQITPRKLPGLVKYDNVTLERGTSSDRRLVDWRKAVVDMAMTGGAKAFTPDGGILSGSMRKLVTIVLHNVNGEAIRTWRLQAAWPISLKYGDLDAQSSDVVIESMVLAHEGLLHDSRESFIPYMPY